MIKGVSFFKKKCGAALVGGMRMHIWCYQLIYYIIKIKLTFRALALHRDQSE